jgi:hypothetical protein
MLEPLLPFLDPAPVTKPSLLVLPCRQELEASRIEAEDGRLWVVGAHCLDLSWPWWAPWHPVDIWPDGNRPGRLQSPA